MGEAFGAGGFRRSLRGLGECDTVGTSFSLHLTAGDHSARSILLNQSAILFVFFLSDNTNAKATLDNMSFEGPTQSFSSDALPTRHDLTWQLPRGQGSLPDLTN